MTNINKPEWFEIAEQDGLAPTRKVSKSLPVSAVLAATMILGVGAFVGQAHEGAPASATENSVIAENASAVTDQTGATTNSSNTSLITAAAPAAAAVAATSGLANPSIATMPTGGEDEDDDHDERGIRSGHDEDDDDYGDGDDYEEDDLDD